MQCPDEFHGSPVVVPVGTETFSLCREALWLIARKICERVGERRRCVAMLPSYTCDTVLSPFEQAGCLIERYPIRRDLAIDVENALSVYGECHADIIVVHPYYGMELQPPEQEFLRRLHDGGCTVVADMTQCLLSESRHDFVDYYVGSLRKWFPIPDGAFALGSEPLHPYPMPENAVAVAMQYDAMQCRRQYFDTGEGELKRLSVQKSHEAEQAMSAPITPHRMSDLSRHLLSCQDAAAAGEARLTNYRHLYTRLGGIPGIELIEGALSRLTTPPLYFPFYADDMHTLQRALAAQGIYARNIWQPSDGILTIDIDQRYDIADMDRVAGEFTVLRAKLSGERTRNFR